MVGRSDAAEKRVQSGHPRKAVSQTHNELEKPAPDRRAVHLVEPKFLVRECVSRCLTAAFDREVVTFSHVEQWQGNNDARTPLFIVLCCPRLGDVGELQRQVALLAEREPSAPIVILSENEDLEFVRAALASGARGYIPMSTGLEEAIEAIRFVITGGTFVPASSIVPSRSPNDHGDAGKNVGGRLLTERQTAVVEALRRGKANKIIAYELNLRESTVKVHVRNIMKKLNAKNRTEVAFIAGELMLDGNLEELA